MPPPFHWGPLSWTQVLGRLGRQGALEEHVVGLVAQVLRCGGPQISFTFLLTRMAVCLWGARKRSQSGGRAGSQDVPGVNVRKLVWMTWIPNNYVSHMVIVAITW
jgi:hypothetical protein